MVKPSVQSRLANVELVLDPWVLQWVITFRALKSSSCPDLPLASCVTLAKLLNLSAYLIGKLGISLAVSHRMKMKAVIKCKVLNNAGPSMLNASLTIVNRGQISSPKRESRFTLSNPKGKGRARESYQGL